MKAARRTEAGPWTRQLWPRLKAYWLAKHLVTGLLMTLFFAGYFTLQAHPLFQVTIMPLTWLDRHVPFEPWTLLFYASLWLYVPMAPMFFTERRDLLAYACSVIGLGVLGLSIFLFWPSSTPAAEVDWAAYPAFAFLHTIDKAGNACPSLHVTFALFSGATVDRLLQQLGATRRARLINWLWCAAIIYSTLATRQHVAVDVGWGLALGTAWTLLHIRLMPAARVTATPLTAMALADKIG